jgi:hypothetical protein
VLTPDPCPSCGAPLGGRAGCQAAFDELSARSWTSPGRGVMHNMLVDAYAMQHPEQYGISAKSYIRHLSALACLIEHPHDDKLYWMMPTETRGPAIPDKPPLLKLRGNITIADVIGIDDDREYQAAMHHWAENVWAAYAPQHGLARAYLSALRGS